MRLSTTLFVAFSTLTLSAQIGRKELRTDSGTVILHYFHSGELSTKEWRDQKDQWGRSWAYKRNGDLLFVGETRRFMGHSTVTFHYHPNGAVSKVETSSAPDAGIQWYKGWTTYDEDGNRTGSLEWGHDNDGPIPRVTVQPHEQPEVAICQKMFTNEVVLVNATRQAGKAKVTARNPSPALKHSEHTLAPGDTVRLGSYSMGETFEAPEKHLSVEVRRVLRNRKKPAALGVLRTDQAQLNTEHRRYYLVVRSWGK